MQLILKKPEQMAEYFPLTDSWHISSYAADLEPSGKQKPSKLFEFTHVKIVSHIKVA